MERRPRPTKKRFGPREAVIAAGLVAGAGALLHDTDPAPMDPVGEDAGGDDSSSPSAKDQPRVSKTARLPKAERPRMSPEEEDHQEHRRVTMDSVLDTLAEEDGHYAVTTTTKVNGKPITDQFFGINYDFGDGNYRDIATVYPDENNGQIYVDPSEELNLWVERTIGQQLNGFLGETPEDVANAASDLLVLEGLYQQHLAGEPVHRSDLAETLLANDYVTTEEAVERREDLEEEARQEAEEDQGDTGW